MNYIGVDCHISSLDFAVVNEKGTVSQRTKVNTGVKEFMKFVKSIPKPRKIFIEEGELAGWLLETSLKFREKLVVTDPKTNKWIGKAGQKNDTIIKKFMKISGIDLIHGATISAIIETPHRFANKKKLWMYAGIGLMERSSGGTIYSRRLTREFNRPLKNTIKQSTEVAILAKDNQFRRQLLRLTMEKGIASHRAKLTVARSILAALYGMWKKGEDYDSEIDKKRENIKFAHTISPKPV